ncbi:MAG: LOG family protein [Ignavibacteria bacterium]|jgi:predicted Rossmann-fold nucleotide-binding protein|nr:LOG family protein [Ignavibacteria bacterium]
MAKIFIEGNESCAVDGEDWKNAELLGFELSKRGHTIVSSARKGIAEAAFVGAIRGNDNSTRIAIDCSEINLPRTTKFTKEIIADNFFDMKMKNCINSDAFIFMPGGFAVLSNLSIILQLKQLELMGNKPVVCVGDQLEEGLNIFGFYNEEVVDSFLNIHFIDTINEAIDIVEKHFRK